jgi:hypothetical protein
MNASDSRPAHANTAERRTILDAIPAIDSSHVPMLSNPGLAIDVTRTAANAVQRSTIGA